MSSLIQAGSEAEASGANGVPVYRLIATDLDGTLVSPGRPLSACSREALNSLIASGLHVVVATGRPFDIVRIHCDGIAFSAPQITYNGAVTYDPLEGRVLALSHVPAIRVHDVIAFLLDADIPAIACAADRVYMDRRIEHPDDWAPPSFGIGTFLADMRKAPVEGIIKIVGESHEESISRIRPVAAAAFGSSLYVTQTSRRLIEFLSPDTSKGAALRRIADSLGVGSDEIVAFGDSHNDLTMFEAAGLSVAMGNASDEVKRAADRVTLRSEEDGVVAMLRELGLVDRCPPTGDRAPE